MIVLDTDHASVLGYPESDRCQRLVARLDAAGDEVVAVTCVTVEEQMRGWLAAIAKERKPKRQVAAYREFTQLWAFFGHFTILPFTDAAAELVESWGGIRIGTMDKKIAATVLSTASLLLTANRRDYALIPGLRFENWVDG
jgi:tRNA(fMet)-specific endonuclease VapC